jgi:hypothetical protein
VIRLNVRNVRKCLIALLGLAFLIGCDAASSPAPLPPARSNAVLRGAPDFTPRPGDIPVPNDLELSDTKFRIHIASNGQLFRNGDLTSTLEIIDELLSIPDIGNVTIMLEGDSDVSISEVSKLQSDLSDAVPYLGSVVFSVSNTPDGG